MRRSNIVRLREQTIEIGKIQVARGTAFHVAPANVDTIFVILALVFIVAVWESEYCTRVIQRVTANSVTSQRNGKYFAA